VAALTADAFGLLFEAARSQSLVDPEAIRNGMASTESYQGITGTFKYDGVSGDPIKSIVLLGISNGEFVFHSRVDP
jgi:branched-chain amino acid transport system substrate-binding protein